ncbi:MAG: response regulator [Candidatus Schekmanbacteria bacterium]|nr:response regulator [Candidatus Schekmanbacteria bacterium]
MDRELSGGLASTALSTVFAGCFFIPPERSFRLDNPVSLVSIAVFLAMGALFSSLHERPRRASHRASAALAAARRELRVAKRNARLLRQHVNDLHDVAMLEAGQTQMHYGNDDLASLTRFLASHFEVLTQERRINYLVTAPNPLRAEIDAEKCQRAILNLLPNAFKLTPQGGTVALTLEGLAECNLANEVAVARDDAEALDYLYRRGSFADRSEGAPAVIMLDLKLPKIDGHEVLRRVRADSQLRLTPVVILTSSREERDLVGCYENGVEALVVKPIAFRELMEAIKSLGLFWAVLNAQPPNPR